MESTVSPMIWNTASSLFRGTASDIEKTTNAAILESETASAKYSGCKLKNFRESFKVNSRSTSKIEANMEFIYRTEKEKSNSMISSIKYDLANELNNIIQNIDIFDNQYLYTGNTLFKCTVYPIIKPTLSGRFNSNNRIG